MADLLPDFTRFVADHLGIEAVERQQRFVIALLHNPALIQHHNLIGILHGCKPLADNDDRPLAVLSDPVQ